jgi:hypothetical protein
LCYRIADLLRYIVAHLPGDWVTFLFGNRVANLSGHGNTFLYGARNRHLDGNTVGDRFVDADSLSDRSGSWNTTLLHIRYTHFFRNRAHHSAALLSGDGNTDLIGDGNTLLTGDWMTDLLWNWNTDWSRYRSADLARNGTWGLYGTGNTFPLSVSLASGS